MTLAGPVRQSVRRLNVTMATKRVARRPSIPLPYAAGSVAEHRLTPKLLKIQRPSGLGTYWVNYVAWTLAHGVTDSLLDGDKRPTDASVYRLTELGKAQAAGAL
jgi:hypothetical protein